MVSYASDDPDGNRATIVEEISQVVRSVLGTDSFRVLVTAENTARVPVLERTPRHTAWYQVELAGKANTPENWERLAKHPKWAELEFHLAAVSGRRMGHHELRLAEGGAKPLQEREMLASRFQALGKTLEKVRRGELAPEAAVAAYERSWLSRTAITDEQSLRQFRADVRDARRRVEAEAVRAPQVQTPVRNR